MKKFGYSVSLRNSCEELREMGEKLLATGEYHAMEVTYSEHMRHVDTTRFNEELMRIIKLYHPEIITHISDFNIAEENEVLQRAIVAEFENCCMYTKMLQGNRIVVHCGSNKLMHISIFHEDGSRQTQEEVFEKLWKLSVETMQELCDIAENYGIIIYTENLSNNKLIQSVEQLNRYITEVDRENLAIVYDIGHSHFTGHDVAAETVACKNRLKHLHIHDNHGKKDEHLPVGDGTIDWKAFCDALEEVHYDGIYLMELYHSTPEALSKCKKEILKYIPGNEENFRA